MLLGWIFFMPFFGMAVGALAGALSGHFANYGIGADFIENVRSKVTPGTSALFLLTGQATIDKVAAAAKQAGLHGELIQSNLSVDAETKLKEAYGNWPRRRLRKDKGNPPAVNRAFLAVVCQERPLNGLRIQNGTSGRNAMTRRIVLIALLVALAWLLAAPPVEAFYYRGGYRGGYGGYRGGSYYHNPYTGGYGGSRSAYNPYTGGYYHGSAYHNPYTGTDAGSRSYYNPYTHTYGRAAAAYNPYTGRYAYGVERY